MAYKPEQFHLHCFAMSPITRFISLASLALWWGSLTTLGFIVVPMLFAHMDTAQAAGRMAAKLFDAQAYLSLVCAALLLALHLRDTPRASFILIVLGLAASLLVQWIVAPHIVARENLRLWHGLGTALYFAQWCCTTGLLYLRSRQPFA
jgi:hypothetical protein